MQHYMTKINAIPPHSNNEGFLADTATEPFADQKDGLHHDTYSTGHLLVTWYSAKFRSANNQAS